MAMMLRCCIVWWWLSQRFRVSNLTASGHL